MSDTDKVGGANINTDLEQTETLEIDNSETKIVNIGKNTKEDCSLYIHIGDRQHKSLWDPGAGKCVISLDTYLNIPNKHKTELFPSPIKIRAANGFDIDNQGECDITFRIGQEKFTFPFLVSKSLTPHVILSYNFSKAFHIATTWNRNDQMCLTKNGKVIATTVSDKAINALVQCT